MVTCVDAFANTLLSAGIEKVLFSWDVRNPSRPVTKIPVNYGAVLKMSASATSGPIGENGIVAVSSMKGLCIVRLQDQSVVKMIQIPGREKAAYHDLQWTPSGLWGAADDGMIDRFEVRSA
mmetsp:Transcript_39380/g.98613  ORF Transcript_39380/g.98613 Transcript_39380/m.98613 type:complete len:121 (+) Transcript_39380:515-877(+)